MQKWPLSNYYSAHSDFASTRILSPFSEICVPALWWQYNCVPLREDLRLLSSIFKVNFVNKIQSCIVSMNVLVTLSRGTK